jgi:hypothetical protein
LFLYLRVCEFFNTAACFCSDRGLETSATERFFAANLTIARLLQLHACSAGIQDSAEPTVLQGSAGGTCEVNGPQQGTALEAADSVEISTEPALGIPAKFRNASQYCTNRFEPCVMDFEQLVAS